MKLQPVSMSKKNILILTNTFPRWKNDATPPFIYQLEKRLAHKFNIIILVPHYFGSKKYEIIDGMEVFRFTYFWPKRLQKLCYDGGILSNLRKHKTLIIQIPFLFLAQFFSIRKIIRRKKINFIHAHWLIPQGLVAAIISLLYRVPYIITIHGGEVFALKSNFINIFLKIALRHGSICTANSEATKKEVISKTNLFIPVEIIPMGIDTNLFTYKCRNGEHNLRKRYEVEGPLLLFIGRLIKEKGLCYLINSMTDIVNNFPSTKLLIIGEGGLKNDMINLTDRLNLLNNIFFLGGIANDKLPEFYGAADIFIGPSLSEGEGITFIEAKICGCPVIGSRVGGIKETITHMETGLLVEPSNSDQIARAVIDLLENNKLRKKLSVNGRRKAIEKFSWDNISNRFQSLYLKMN